MPTGPPQTSGMNQMSTFEPKNHYGNKGYNQKISVLEKLKIVVTWSLKLFTDGNFVFSITKSLQDSLVYKPIISDST